METRFPSALSFPPLQKGGEGGFGSGRKNSAADGRLACPCLLPSAACRKIVASRIPAFTPATMPRFSANLSLLFTERPFLERFAAAAAAGFRAVEFQFPYAFPKEEVAAAARTAGRCSNS